MNLRKQKQIILARMGRIIMFIRRHDLNQPMVMNYIEVRQAKVEYICSRAKDGVVVDVFDTVQAARTLVDKHIKQRKAHLLVTNSLTGEIQMFEGEAA
jgi:6-pyruvoyl-tetrahydropterin synthase